MKKKKKKMETSKKLCIACLVVMLALTIFAVINDGLCIRLSIQLTGKTIIPIQTIIMVNADIGFYLSYLGYNGYLKNSRNKYLVDENGEPYRQKVEDWVNQEIKKQTTKRKGAKRNDTHS